MDDNRNYGRERPDTYQDTYKAASPARSTGSTALWFILGGVVVVLAALIYFLSEGMPDPAGPAVEEGVTIGNEPALEAPAAVGSAPAAEEPAPEAEPAPSATGAPAEGAAPQEDGTAPETAPAPPGN